MYRSFLRYLQSNMVKTLIYILALTQAVHTGAQGTGDSVDDSPQARDVFHLADLDNNDYLSYGEFQHLFRSFDDDGNGNVTSTEFLDHWQTEQLGTVDQGLRLFLNLDVSKTSAIDITNDMPYIFRWFDINVDMMVTEGEFVIQWVKISA